MKLNPSLLPQHLDYLKLPFLQNHHAELAQQSAQQHWDHLEYLRRLIEGEYTQRRQRVIERRVRAARFPVLKTLEQFRWDWPKKINRLAVQNLFRLEFLAQKANVVLLGNVGLGKTHLAIALGYAACQEGYSVLFADAISVINDLCAAQKRGLLKRQLKKYLAPELLLLDEIGYLPIDQHGADLLFQVISQRYERGSIVLTTNKPIQAMGLGVQQRQHHRLGRPGPALASRRHGGHRRQQLPNERSGQPVKRAGTHGFSHRRDRNFKPAVFLHFRAAAHMPHTNAQEWSSE